jgi:hypothetical protein
MARKTALERNGECLCTARPAKTGEGNQQLVARSRKEFGKFALPERPAADAQHFERPAVDSLDHAFCIDYEKRFSAGFK